MGENAVMGCKKTRRKILFRLTIAEDRAKILPLDCSLHRYIHFRCLIDNIEENAAGKKSYVKETMVNFCDCSSCSYNHEYYMKIINYFSDSSRITI